MQPVPASVRNWLIVVAAMIFFMIVIGALRMGGELWQTRAADVSMEAFARETFRELWKMLAEFGEEAGERL